MMQFSLGLLLVVALLSGCVAQDSHDKTRASAAPSIALTNSQFYVGNGTESAQLVEGRVDIEGISATTEAIDAKANKAIRLSFKESWQGRAHMRVNTPLDLSADLASYVLEFNVLATDVSKAGLQVAVECGEGCKSVVDIWPSLKEWQSKGWHKMSIPLTCFSGKHADFSFVSEPFKLMYYGTGDVSFADINIAVHNGGSKSSSKGKTSLEENVECTSQDLLSVTPVPLRAFWADEWWMKRHNEKKVSPIRSSAELLLIGDSITHGWESTGKDVWQTYFSHIPTLNLGFGGDRTENVLWRIEQGELDALAPKLIVMMIGTNNTGHRMDHPENIAKGVSRILDEFNKQLPDSRVLLLGIFPRGENDDSPERINNQKVNELLFALAKNKGVDYANINSAFLNAQGELTKEIMPDLLHPSEEGYRRWAEALSPYLAPFWGV